MRGVLLLSALVGLVLGRGTLQARQLLAPLPETGDRVLVVACVGSLPAADESGWYFDARADFPQHPLWVARRLRLRLPVSMPAPRVGDCWQYAARLGQPRGAAAARALLRNHLSGYAQVDEGPLNQRVARQQPGLAALRAHLARRIGDQVADPGAAALLAALAVGATGEVSERQWQVFNATGITHLIAISGLHVTFFAMLAMAVARWLWRRLAPRRWLPRQGGFAAVVGCLMALLYALLSGFSVPAQRTVVMLVAFLGARECARQVAPWWSIGAALAAVLLFDPLAVFSAGFWLSFVAVTAIVVLHGGRLAQPAPLAAALQLQWRVSLALLPVTVMIFGSFSAIGLLVNLLAIPVFSVLLVPLVLVATALTLLPGAATEWCAGLLVRMAGEVAVTLWPALAWCADLPGSLWLATPTWGWRLLAVPVTLLALSPVARRKRLVALLLLCTVFWLRAPRPPPAQLWIDFRGDGAAAFVVLRTHDHLLLLGTGERWSSNGRGFARQVLPRLRAAGYPAIDLWLPGTFTRDAQKALTLAAGQVAVRQVLLPPRQAPPPELRSCAPSHWQWDGVDFRLDAGSDGKHCVLVASVEGHGIEFIGTELPQGISLGLRDARMKLDAAGPGLRAGLIGL